MIIQEKQEKIVNKNLFYSNFINNRKKEIKTKFLYIIKKPNKLIKWFTTNPDIAEYASRCGLIVTCKSIKKKIII